MAKSGARLVEVGTTNRTHVDDYRPRARRRRPRVIVKVHRSNFEHRRVRRRRRADRARRARRRTRQLPLLHDLGSGLLLALDDYGLTRRTDGRATRSAPAPRVVTMSGDKLLGGPQAGIILGARDASIAIRTNPLTRSYRVDKLTLAALEATLALYRDPPRALREIPGARAAHRRRRDLRCARRASARSPRARARSRHRRHRERGERRRRRVSDGAHSVDCTRRCRSTPDRIEQRLRASAIRRSWRASPMAGHPRSSHRSFRRTTSSVASRLRERSLRVSGRLAAFLDRDGTIIRDASYVRDPARRRAASRCGRRHSPTQRRAASGHRGDESVGHRARLSRRTTTTSALTQRLDALLAASGARIDATYMCPHHPDITGPCDCRKPGLALYRQRDRRSRARSPRVAVHRRPLARRGARRSRSAALAILARRGRRRRPRIARAREDGVDRGASLGERSIDFSRRFPRQPCGNRLRAMRSRIAVLASGGGSNLQAILDHFDQARRPARRRRRARGEQPSRRRRARARATARAFRLASSCDEDDARMAHRSARCLDEHEVDLIVLAGYLKLVPVGRRRAIRRDGSSTCTPRCSRRSAVAACTVNACIAPCSSCRRARHRRHRALRRRGLRPRPHHRAMAGARVRERRRRHARRSRAARRASRLSARRRRGRRRPTTLANCAPHCSGSTPSDARPAFTLLPHEDSRLAENIELALGCLTGAAFAGARRVRGLRGAAPAAQDTAGRRPLRARGGDVDLARSPRRATSVAATDRISSARSRVGRATTRAICQARRRRLAAPRDRLRAR